jgi:hypothetical protein
MWFKHRICKTYDTHVHFDTKEGKWYFWDETEADRCGPYSTQSKAEAALMLYAAENLESGPIKINLQKDGDQWCATVDGAFVDLQNSFAGFGNTKDLAVKNLFFEVNYSR